VARVMGPRHYQGSMSLRDSARDRIATPRSAVNLRRAVTTARHISKSPRGLIFTELLEMVDVPVLVGNCVSSEVALELMETGIHGVLVGVGPGATCTTRGSADYGRVECPSSGSFRAGVCMLRSWRAGRTTQGIANHRTLKRPYKSPPDVDTGVVSWYWYRRRARP